MFLKRREVLDYKRFAEVSNEQNKVMELIKGMQEIKLHNAEKQKRWGWEYIQARLFRVSIKGLVLEQSQTIGSSVINELKNIFIILLSAKLVIEGSITLGMMLAISAIVGSLNGPITQLIEFVRELQDAKISLARLSEIHQKEDELQQEAHQTNEIPHDADIEINTDLGFVKSDLELTNIDDIDNANYIGNVIFEEFDIGQLIDDPKAKFVTANLDLDGKGFTLDNLRTDIKGDVFSLVYNGYTYQGVNLSGDLGNKIFNGSLKRDV